MNGGNDDLRVLTYELTVSGALRGGAGTDKFSLGSLFDNASVSSNLARGRMTVGFYGDAPDQTFSLDRWNALQLTGYRVDVVGRDSDESFNIQSCQGAVDGAGGDDSIVLRSITDEGQPYCSSGGQVTLRGGIGNDTLTGGFFDDILIGDEGTDTADGGSGIDSCNAETTTRCETVTP